MDLGELRQAHGSLVMIHAYDTVTGEPIEWLRGRKNSSNEPALVTADGVATWLAEEPGHHRYFLEAPGYVTSMVEAEVGDGQEVIRKAVTMERAGDLSVSVVDSMGRPAIGARLKIAPSADEPQHPAHEIRRHFSHRLTSSYEAEVAVDGRVHFFGLPSGPYEIFAENPEGVVDRRRRKK